MDLHFSNGSILRLSALKDTRRGANLSLNDTESIISPQ